MTSMKVYKIEKVMNLLVETQYVFEPIEHRETPYQNSVYQDVFTIIDGKKEHFVVFVYSTNSLTATMEFSGKIHILTAFELNLINKQMKKFEKKAKEMTRS